MQALLDAVIQELRSFVAQRSDVGMLLLSGSEDALPILTALEDVEAQSLADQFWLVTEPFNDLAAYVDTLVDTFLTREEAVRLSAAREGIASWSPPPAALRDPNLPPVERLRLVCAFSRELLPDTSFGASVWILHPLEVSDEVSFCDMVARLLQHELPDPWCQRLRFIIRVDPANPAAAALASQPRVRAFRPDLGPDAVARHLGANVDDESLPVDERMGSLMILAGADQAMHRHRDAFEKYGFLNDYHAAVGNTAMAAVALNGMADAAEALGDDAQAGDCYERALAIAGQEPHPPVPLFLNLTMGIGRLRLKEDRYAEAEAWFDMAQQLAIPARSVAMRIQALELRGVCQHAQRRYEEAESSWTDGSVLAAQMQDVAACRGLVLRLFRHYRDSGQVEAARERHAQLVDLGHTGPL